MLRYALILAPFLGLAAMSQAVVAPAFAQTQSQTDKVLALTDALRLPGILDVVAQEGVAGAANVEDEMFPGRGGSGWQADIERLYDRDRLKAIVDEEFPKRLTEEHVDILLTFFTSDLGDKATLGELEGRRALLDEDLDAAAQDVASEMRVNNHPRAKQIERFIEAYDLITSNVVGGLNSNYAFFQGLADGGALPETMTEADIANTVWQNEAEIRRETEDWLYTYLILAYSALSDDELETYIAFAETDAAIAFNTAVFEAFDLVFTSISRDMGRLVAGYMLAQDI